MKAKFILGSVAALLLATALNTQAQTRTPVVNARERNQAKRINNGVRNGELTPSEAYRLRTRERNIRTEKRIAKSNGYVSPAERARLNRKENRVSRAIYRKKHNNRVY